MSVDFGSFDWPFDAVTPLLVSTEKKVKWQLP